MGPPKYKERKKRKEKWEIEKEDEEEVKEMKEFLIWYHESMAKESGMAP